MVNDSTQAPFAVPSYYSTEWNHWFLVCVPERSDAPRGEGVE